MSAQFHLEAASNPIGWVFAEYAPGKRVLADHFPDRSVLTGREDVQINTHGVVLFYNTDTANLLLTRFTLPALPMKQDTVPLDHHEPEIPLSDQKVTVQITDVNSTQEWTTDPAMIEVQVSAAFLEKAERCIAFMNENDVDEVVIDSVLGYTFYELAEDAGETTKEVIVGDDEYRYSEYDPEYTVTGCNAKIAKSGAIMAVMPFKHTSDELRCDIGTLDDLMLKLNAVPAPGPKPR